jgi:hypothetical protein
MAKGSCFGDTDSLAFLIFLILILLVIGLGNDGI